MLGTAGFLCWCGSGFDVSRAERTNVEEEKFVDFTRSSGAFAFGVSAVFLQEVLRIGQRLLGVTHRAMVAFAIFERVANGGAKLRLVTNEKRLSPVESSRVESRRIYRGGFTGRTSVRGTKL